jgi:general secretion pathway protein H
MVAAFATDTLGLRAAPSARRALPRDVANERGLTLIELLVTITLIAVVTTGVIIGSGALTNSRMRGAAGMITGAVRIAFTRASATSRPNRLVFDIDNGAVILEETSDALTVKKDDTAGGAAAATQEEREAIETASRIVKGPQAPRARFRPVRALGFDDPDTSGGRPIGKGVRFRKVETAHSPDGQMSGRAYLYFWPGGQTERASIQLSRTGSSDESDGMTILVSALTGRVRTMSGAQSMDPLRDDGTVQEREDRNF